MINGETMYSGFVSVKLGTSGQMAPSDDDDVLMSSVTLVSLKNWTLSL